MRLALQQVCKNTTCSAGYDVTRAPVSGTDLVAAPSKPNFSAMAPTSGVAQAAMAISKDLQGTVIRLSHQLGCKQAAAMLGIFKEAHLSNA